MKKHEFLQKINSLLSELGDDDEVVVMHNFGEYWGDYELDPEFEVTELHVGTTIGPPKNLRCTNAKKFLIIR